MRKAPSYESQALRDFAEVLMGRRTIELFLQTPVPKALLLEAIEAATWAPNHRLTEPWRFYLLGEESTQRCLDLCEKIVTANKGADAGRWKRESWAQKPGWLVVTCQSSDDELLQREDYGATCAAIQNALLYLWKAGVGSKWTSGAITRDSRFFDIVGIDEHDEFVVGLVWYGYPKLTPTQSRTPVADVLRELS